MSKRYPGNFITGNPVALSQTSNNGIWDLKDVSTATANNTWQEPDGYYEIPKSLRFRNSASTYLSRTFATAGNRTTWTWSAWVKRGSVSTTVQMFASRPTASPYSLIYFASDGTFQMDDNGSCGFSTVALFRDPSAWYHLVISLDTTRANSSDRIRVFVNGIQQKCTYTVPTLNAQTQLNTASNHTIGKGGDYTAEIFDGHMSEINFIDGQALDPSYFGYFDPITNIWQPKKYTGAYGTNGFYLPFTENGSTAQLGKNFGNGSNYITYSEQFNNANWLKPAAPVAPTVSTNAIAAPDGLTTADAVVFSGSTTHPAYQEYTPAGGIPNGQSWTASMYVKQATGTSFALQCTIFTASSGPLQDGYNNFDFDSATNSIRISSTESNSYMKVGSQYIGNGWHRVWATNTNISGSTGSYIRMSIGQRSAPTAWSIYCWGAQLTLGTTLLPYTATTASAISYDWTTNNISLTAGATYDSMVDSPTNVFTTATDVGGVVSGNYCTLNSSNKSTGGGTLSEGNLRITTTGGNHTVCGTMAFPPSGKWYFEAIDTITGGNSAVGILQQNQSLETNVVSANINMKYNNMADNATFGFAVNMDNLTYTWYKNGVVASSGSASTGSLVAGVTYVPFCMTSGSGGASTTFNFGQRPFAYTPPAGYKSLNTTNIQALGTSGVGNAAITPHKWFDINLYGGTGTPRTITNSGFQPDLVWTKVRNTTYSYNIADSARGAGLRLYSDGTATEGANPNGGVTSFTTPTNNGYTIDGGVEVNESGRPYISWQWKQSPTAGLNVISYTGDGTNNRAISHNLNATPAFIITKNRDQAYNWDIYHQSLGIGATMTFNTGLGSRNVSAFGTTAPTSSNFYTQNNYTNTSTNKYVAYLWAEIPGFSKFGSFPGNSSADGPFAYCGFRPKIVIIRSTAANREWNVWDTARGLFNLSNISQLDWGQSHAEYTTSGYNDVVDFLSNGFKLRSAASPNYNGAETYVWAAFAESPFGLNNRAR